MLQIWARFYYMIIIIDNKYLMHSFQHSIKWLFLSRATQVTLYLFLWDCRLSRSGSSHRRCSLPSPIFRLHPARLRRSTYKVNEDDSSRRSRFSNKGKIFNFQFYFNASMLLTKQFLDKTFAAFPMETLGIGKSVGLSKINFITVMNVLRLNFPWKLQERPSDFIS